MYEYTRRLTQHQREDVIRRDGGMCYYCGEIAEVVDHIIPWSWNHSDDDGNLVASCAICNLIAGDKVFESLEHKRKYVLGRRDKRKWRHRIEALRLAGYCIGCGERFTSKNPQETLVLCKACYSGVPAIHKTPQDIGRKPQEYVHDMYISGDGKSVENDTQPTLEVDLAGNGICKDEKLLIEKLNTLSIDHSWRKIAQMEPFFSAGINFATLCRYANGDEIQNQDHRKALGLQYKELIASCPQCGEIHNMLKTCKADRRKRHRIAISKLDPASAARSIRENCYFGVDELVKELKCQT